MSDAVLAALINTMGAIVAALIAAIAAIVIEIVKIKKKHKKEKSGTTKEKSAPDIVSNQIPPKSTTSKQLITILITIFTTCIISAVALWLISPSTIFPLLRPLVIRPEDCTYRIDNAQGGTETIPFSGCRAAKIRIEMNKRAMPGYGYSLLDVEAYETACSSISGETDLVIGGKATASSVENDAVALYKPNNAIDGYLDTRWSSKFSDPQWLEIELPASQAGKPIKCVVLNWELAFAVDYSVTIVP
jgi:hypothetical protein